MATYQDRMHYSHSTHQPDSSYNPQKQVKSFSSNVLSLVKTIGHHLLSYLSQGSELRVWQTTDRQGTTWWNVYDPVTQRSVRLISEAEVLTWIEQRYSKKFGSW